MDSRTGSSQGFPFASLNSSLQTSLWLSPHWPVLSLLECSSTSSPGLSICIHSQSLRDLIPSHDFQYHLYIDIFQFLSPVPPSLTPDLHFHQLFSISIWPSGRHLELNVTKTELIFPSTLVPSLLSPLSINGNMVLPPDGSCPRRCCFYHTQPQFSHRPCWLSLPDRARAHQSSLLHCYHPAPRHFLSSFTCIVQETLYCLLLVLLLGVSLCSFLFRSFVLAFPLDLCLACILTSLVSAQIYLIKKALGAARQLNWFSIQVLIQLRS